ncbi:MAG TPA: hypothetical protein VGD76_11425 [Ramlibacter sp.]
MNERGEEIAKTVFQVLAIVLLAGIVLVILHKGYTDFGTLAKQNPGGDFWPALGRYIFRNLAGG